MASIDPCVRIRLIQPPSVTKEFVESPTAGATLERSVSRISRITAVLKVADPNLGVPCTCNDGTVVGVGHEFDAENIRVVTSSNTGVEGERFSKIGGVVVPDVQVGVIRA